MSNDNAGQKEFWSEAGGADWLANEAVLDASFADIDTLLIERGTVSGAMHVMDLGCGTGSTSRRIAQALGDGGRVTGVDISPRLLAEARRIGGQNIAYLDADAQDYRFAPAQFDLILSRFGSMFFADPTVAFANLRGTLKPYGRMVLACWRRAKENPWFVLPFKAAVTHFGPPGEIDPNAPGPTAFGDEARVVEILGQAGFQDPKVEIIELEMPFPGAVDTFIDLAAKIGPMGRLAQMHEPDEAAIKAAREMLSEALQPWVRDGAIMIPARINLFSARV